MADLHVKVEDSMFHTDTFNVRACP